MEWRPLLSAVYPYMFEGTGLWSRLEEARRRLEETLPGDALYQLRESVKITYYRHVVPVAYEAKADIIEDALPLYIMYIHNAAESVAPYSGRLAALPDLVYPILSDTLAKEPRGSPVRRGLELLQRSDRQASRGEGIEDELLGPLYSLSFTVAVVAYLYASKTPVMRLALAPLYALAKASIEKIEGPA